MHNPLIDIVTWVFEEGTFIPAARITDKGCESIITDYLGTPNAMFDSNGIKTWEADLDIYGRVRTFAGRSLNSCPWRFQGQYFDCDTALYYNFHRWYDPDIGSYISQDPIGLLGGNPTLYGYVCDTNSWVDVFGLDCKKQQNGFIMNPQKKTNKTEGLRREDTFRRLLEDIHGKDKVLRERMLLGINGNKVVDANGKGRRIDFIVLDSNGNALKSYEVTSKTTNETAQIAKETNIRNNGGVFVKDSNGNLVDVSNVNTQIIRIK